MEYHKLIGQDDSGQWVDKRFKPGEGMDVEYPNIFVRFWRYIKFKQAQRKLKKHASRNSNIKRAGA